MSALNDMMRAGSACAGSATLMKISRGIRAEEIRRRRQPVLVQGLASADDAPMAGDKYGGRIVVMR